jgi:Raf kinase inhibitor-like YbhB/YbcL family protein
MRRTQLLFATIAATAFALLGCGGTEPEPERMPVPPAATEPAETPEIEETTEDPAPSPDPATAPVEPEGETAMPTLEVTSPAFAHEGAIPLEFTGDGADVPPDLAWTEGPEGTACYALIMDDPDAPAGTWVHWVIWNIPQPSLESAIPKQESLEDGTAQGTNSWSRIGYGGPAPPSGTHRYFFKVYALDAMLDLPSTTTKEVLLSAMEGHILATGELMGTYSRE